MSTNIAYLDESISAGWERTLYAFLAEKERRSGSQRTVQSYSRMLHDFFGRVGKTPDEVTSQEVFAWGLWRRPFGQAAVVDHNRRSPGMPQQLLPVPDPQKVVAANPCEAIEGP